MKKRVMAILCAAGMLVSMTACGAAKPADAAGAATDAAATDAAVATDTAAATDTADAAGATIDLGDAKFLTDGVLNVGAEVGYPPFEDFAEDGTTPIGYDIDIITAVADKLGLDVNIINTAWDGIFAGIGVNYDVACSAVTITPERKETMLFSDPYINNYQAVVLPADSDKTISSFNDLDGMTIALQKETTSDILMSDYKSTGTIDIQIVANEKITSCFTQLQNGEVDAVVVDSTVADGFINSSDAFKIAYEDQEEAEQFGIAMAKENTGLQKAINQALKELEEEGFIEESYNYWFGSAAE